MNMFCICFNKVIMGGGRQEFLTTADHDIEGVSGKRTDGNNLIREWKHKHRRFNAEYVDTKDALLNVSILTRLRQFCVAAI